MEGILEKFMRDAARTPDRPMYDFLDCGTDPFIHNTVTIGEAWQHAMDMAAELRQQEAKKGDRAIILSMQDSGTVYAIWGCMIVGVVFTVIPPPIDDGKLDRFISVLKSCKPRFLISNEGLEKQSDTDVTSRLLKKAFLQVVALKRVYTDKVLPAAAPIELYAHSAHVVVPAVPVEVLCVCVVEKRHAPVVALRLSVFLFYHCLKILVVHVVVVGELYQQLLVAGLISGESGRRFLARHMSGVRRGETPKHFLF
mgnify:CR=1 FL=1